MKWLALGLAVIVVLLVVAQLTLPRLAERHVREELRREGGTVASVEVKAFPAVKLLFRHADEVRAHLTSAQLAGAGDVAAELRRANGVGHLEVRVDRMALGPLRLRDLRLTKRGDRLHGEAAVTREDLARAMPAQVGLEPVAAGDGTLVLKATAGPFTVRARLSARDGALVIAPDGLLGGFASLTVFNDPRLPVTGVGARMRPDGYTFTADGRLT